MPDFNPYGYGSPDPSPHAREWLHDQRQQDMYAGLYGSQSAYQGQDDQQFTPDYSQGIQPQQGHDLLPWLLLGLAYLPNILGHFNGTTPPPRAQSHEPRAPWPLRMIGWAMIIIPVLWLLGIVH